MDISIEQKFYQLAEEWRNETGGYSLITQKMKHPKCQEIINMGESIVPLLLNELKNNKWIWFYPLQTITGIELNKKFKGEDWITWGKQQGYISSNTLSY